MAATSGLFDDLEGDHHAFEVSEDHSGQRLDTYLHEHIPETSRSALQRMIKDGRVRLAGATAKSSTALARGQKVEIVLPPPPPIAPLPEDIPLEIVHEDEHILVINKPSDLVVHPSPDGLEAGGTLVNALLGRTSRLSLEGGTLRPGIVHRLDRETTGVMVIARTDEAHRHLAAQFKERLVKKQYLAFCHGRPKQQSGDIDAPIGRSLTQRKKMAIRHDEAARAAHTRWQVEGHVGDFTAFRCFPTSGRTHQIRLHLKSIGHPIVCDALYGREKSLSTEEVMGKKPGPAILTRHALHAAVLQFAHPATEQQVSFEAPLPEDMFHLFQLLSE